MKYSNNNPSHIIYYGKTLPYFSIHLEHIVTDSLELKLRVPEHTVPNILEIQLGVRQTM